MKWSCAVPEKKEHEANLKKTDCEKKIWVEVTILSRGRVELFLSLPAVEGLFEGVRSAALPTGYGSNQAQCSENVM